MVDPDPERVKARAGEEDEGLLDAVLVRLGLVAAAYRHRRAGPRRRLRERAAAIGLGPSSYPERVAASSIEQRVAEGLVTVTRSRIWRHPALWTRLEEAVLPPVAARRPETRIWSAVAASGEEAYSVALLWRSTPALAGRPLRVVATDVRGECLAAARSGRFPPPSLRELPAGLREGAFTRQGEAWVIDASLRRLVHVAPCDLERDPWPRELDLILLRDAVFTYGGPGRRERTAARAAAALRSHGWLALGEGEVLGAAGETWFERPDPGLPLYRLRH